MVQGEHRNTTRHRLMGLASLMSRAFRGEDLSLLGSRLIESVGEHPDIEDADALLDLSIILHLKSQGDIALDIQSEALRLQQCYRLPARHEPAIRLLAIMAPGDLATNTPLEFLVEDSDIELNILFVAPWLPLPERVPDHDVAFVAVSESSERAQTLLMADALAQAWPRPLLNAPGRIASLSRDRVSTELEPLPGLEVPATLRVERAVLESVARGQSPLHALVPGGDFPLVIRPLDSHAGKGLSRVGSVPELESYLGGRSEKAFYVSRFIDYRSADGQFRKYRLVLIDGRPYAAHMAISDHWMVHYMNAGMAEAAEKRAEEACFMAGFDESFAQRHAGALRDIYEHVGLDYLVIDCAETGDGRLLLFEVDNSAVVHAMDSPELFPYKGEQLARVAGAFRDMLLRAGGRETNAT